MLKVSIDAGYSYHNGTGGIRVPTVGDNQGTLAELQLGTVIPDPQPLGKPKRLAQPIDSLPDIRVGKLRDDHRRGAWNGSYGSISPSRVLLLGYFNAWLAYKK
jgi:hypothetical protein